MIIHLEEETAEELAPRVRGQRLTTGVNYGGRRRLSRSVSRVHDAGSGRRGPTNNRSREVVQND